MPNRPAPPVRTRAEVEREVYEAEFWTGTFSAKNAKRVTAALLAMAACDGCMSWPNAREPLGECETCLGTGLDQSRIAAGLAKLRGEGT